MVVRINFAALKEGRWYEYLVRFCLGGLATVIAGVITDICGPAVGGLFLAFPAIFFASATLIEKHERERRKENGLRGACRGKQAAALDAAGAGRGSLGLAAFALLMWYAAPSSGIFSLALASLVWLVIGVLLWRQRHAWRRL